MAVTKEGFSAYIKANMGIIIEDILSNGNSMNPKLGLSVFTDVKSAAEKVLNLSATLKLNQGNPSTAFNAALADATKMSAAKVNGVKVENTQYSLMLPYNTYEFDDAITAAEKRSGSDGDDAVYLTAITALVADNLVILEDEMLFQGDTDSVDENYNGFDGFVKQITEATGDAKAIRTGVAAAKLTISNAVAKVEKMITLYNENNPKLIKVSKRLFVSNSDFEVIQRAYVKNGTGVDKNSIIADADIREFTVPGSKVIVTATDGLDGTFERILCRPIQLSPVTDSITEDSNLDVVFNEITDTYYVKAKFKLGAKAHLTNEMVIDAIA